VSNICDQAYLGFASTLAVFSPLLENPVVNPHATLITLFMNAVEEEFMNCGDDNNVNVIMKEMKLVTEYAGYPPNVSTNDPNLMQLLLAKPLVREKEKYLEK
jgi:hypothetical protein